jgi:hypothetical protein
MTVCFPAVTGEIQIQSHPGSKPVLYLLSFKQNMLEGDLEVNLRMDRI